MVVKISQVLSSYFAEKEVYSREKAKIYAYGFELLISTLLNGLGIFLICVYMGIVLEGMLFVLAFVPLRLTAGGYHAKHHWSCFMVINILFLFFAIILKYISAGYAAIYTILSVMISSLAVWLLSPVEAVNKPLRQPQKEKLRDRSIVIVSLNIGVVLFFSVVLHVYPTLLLFYVSGASAASILLTVAVVQAHQAARKSKDLRAA